MIPELKTPGVGVSGGGVRWLFFDFVGTLAFNDPPRAWHYLRACARRGVFLNRRDVWDAMREAWAEVDHPDRMEHLEASRDRGSYEAFRARMEHEILERLGIESDREAIVDDVLAAQDQPDAYSLYPEAETALRRLSARGYRICIVSNFSWALRELTDELGIGCHCSAVVTSAQVGYRKPHSGIFRAALEATGARPDEVLFIGDTMKDDVRGAAEFGFRSVLVDRRQSGRHDWPSIALLTDLEQLLLEQPERLSLPSLPTSP